ncbi:hypothetical protein CL657_03205 [bacterium]|nr:hypothetical protein [bacterium]
MIEQEQLVGLLKQKGTGKTMSKSLTVSQCKLATDFLLSANCSITTKTTLLMAFLMLSNTDDEQLWLTELTSNYLTRVPADCFFLFDPDYVTASPPIQDCIYKLLSHDDLTEQELAPALDDCFDAATPEHLIAAFFEGLRLKEESYTENQFFLTYCFNQASHTQIDTPYLIDLASAYDGFNRHPNLLLGLAPLLASLGYPTIIHGCEDVSPKFGITPFKLLTHAQKNPLKSLKSIKTALETPNIGWGYCDQSLSFPALHNLRQCRKDMVKRPVLATIEKFLQPFISKNKNYLITGYTHPAYKDKTAELLNSLTHCDNYTFVRGVEGSSLAPLDRRCPLITKHTYKTSDSKCFSSPSDFKMELLPYVSANPEITVEESLYTLLIALQDSQSFVGKWLIYNGLLILKSLGLSTNDNETKVKLMTAIDSGLAYEHWTRF